MMADPKRKIDILDKSLESGVIDKEEHSKLKEELEPQAKEFDRKILEMNKENELEEPNKFQDKLLFISIALIALLFISVLAYSRFYKPKAQTLEDLHILNLNGKLAPGQGYVYKGVYSFVTLDNQWYTQLKSPKGTKVYSLALRYSPRDLKDIVIEGKLDKEFFDGKSEFFVTFNPTGKDFSSVALAVADFNTHMSKVFEKNPIAACDRNETDACKTRPVVTCEDPSKLVLYIRESNKLRAYYNNNCIVVEGKGFDLIKGVDRILYNLYGIMGQEEGS